MGVGDNGRRLVCFDAVFTLFDLHPTFSGAFARVCHDFGYPVEDVRVEEVMGECLKRHEEEVRGRVSHACSHESLVDQWVRFNHEVFEALGIEGDALALSLELERRFDSGEYAHVFAGAVETIRRVKGLGVTTAIVSNGTGGMATCLRALGLEAEVDFVVISALAGWEKPAVEIFRVAQARGGVGNPARCVMLGDNHFADVRGARDAGWRAVWYNPKGKPAPEGDEATEAIGSLEEFPGWVERWLTEDGA